MAWPDLADDVLKTALAEFGQPTTYTPRGGVAFPLTGIFDAAYQLVSLGGDVEIDAVGPVLGVRLADFATPPAHGDGVVIAGTSYVVRSVQPDGQGGARLVLHPAA